MLLPFLLKQHRTWRKCRLRIFTVAQVTKYPTTREHAKEYEKYKVGEQRLNQIHPGGRQLHTNEERLEDLPVSLKVRHLIEDVCGLVKSYFSPGLTQTWRWLRCTTLMFPLTPTRELL